MNLNLIERHWDTLVDTILDHFPELDRKRISDFQGRISALVEHLAETHHLTRQEAVETLEERILMPATAAGHRAERQMAAE